MRVLRSRQFLQWVERLIETAGTGDEVALATARYVLDEIDYLHNLQTAPSQSHETATLKWVRQSKRHLIWRLSHPHDERVAVRLIVWFDDADNSAVVLVLAGDKARLGDLFYESVGTRADQVIDLWKLENRRSRR